MCGIFGIHYFNRERNVDKNILIKMGNTLVHRGPDGEGYHISGNTGLGHRRLSIIDLQTGNQPIFNEKRDIAVVLNGEIYNFRDLRSELEKNGHKFSTNSDTEVIVHLYEEKGRDCLSYLRGMFSFALFDEKSGTLFLARDRLGKKPLYYSVNNESFIFSSEISTFLCIPSLRLTYNYEAIDSYLSLQFIPDPLSAFNEIKKLPPAHYILLDSNGFRVERYWEIPHKTHQNRDEREVLEELDLILREAVRIRLISDVPLGVFLSGGLDSSVICYLMAMEKGPGVKSFSIGFEDETYNELAYARLVSQMLKTDHHEFIVKYEIEDILQKIIPHFGEPFADSSAIPTYYVSAMASGYVKVALSGDGGDEVFGGYRRYVAGKMAGYFNILPPRIRKYLIENPLSLISEGTEYYGRSNIKKAKLFMRFLSSIKNGLYWYCPFSEDEKRSLFRDDFYMNHGKKGKRYFQFDSDEVMDDVSRAILYDLKFYLPCDILTKVDRMSMACSIETRAPFLDHKLVELMAGLPSHLKIKGITTKYILKKWAKGKLPIEIIHRSKQGFAVPLARWIKNELKDFVYSVLFAKNSFCDRFFNLKYVEKLLENHIRGYEDNSHRIYSLLILNLWDSWVRECRGE